MSSSGLRFRFLGAGSWYSQSSLAFRQVEQVGKILSHLTFLRAQVTQVYGFVDWALSESCGGVASFGAGAIGTGRACAGADGGSDMLLEWPHGLVTQS